MNVNPVMVGIWSNGEQIRAAIITQNFGKQPIMVLDAGEVEIYLEGKIVMGLIEPVARYVIEHNIQHVFA